jgi:hypothetical protein
MSDAVSEPAEENTISITTARRSVSGLSEVRSVESFSGSIGKICAAV